MAGAEYREGRNTTEVPAWTVLSLARAPYAGHPPRSPYLAVTLAQTTVAVVLANIEAVEFRTALITAAMVPHMLSRTARREATTSKARGGGVGRHREQPNVLFFGRARELGPETLRFFLPPAGALSPRFRRTVASKRKTGASASTNADTTAAVIDTSGDTNAALFCPRST